MGSRVLSLGLLQQLVVLFQHGPGLGRHEAVGRVLSLASHLAHARARDEIVILMAAIKTSRAEQRETEWWREKGSSELQTHYNQWKDAYQRHGQYEPARPAALLQSAGSRRGPVNISANQNEAFMTRSYDTSHPVKFDMMIVCIWEHIYEWHFTCWPFLTARHSCKITLWQER